MQVWDIYANYRRIRYVETNLRTKVIKLYPWAQYLLRVTEGFWAFEDYQDFLTAREEVINGSAS